MSTGHSALVLLSTLIFVAARNSSDKHSNTDKYTGETEDDNISLLYQVPEYFLRVYETMARNENDARGSRPTIPGVVRGFIGAATNTKNGFIFNLTGKTSYSMVWSAKVVVWKVVTKVNATVDPTERVWVYLYDQASRQKIGEVITSITEEEYLTFQILYTYTNWFRNPRSNQGLYLDVQCGRKPSLSAAIAFILDGEADQRKGPVLVEYAEDEPGLPSLFSYIATKRPRPVLREPAILVRNHSALRRSISDSTTGKCRLSDMMVSFVDLGWQTFVIAPRKYNARRCVGLCTFPLHSTDDPTNHANIQVKMYNIGLGKGVGPPCCVPTKLSAHSLVVSDTPGEMLIRQYQELVVTSCGCR